jgi:prepilin-type N-terminal cleavage/methylation domain-containing protein
MIPFLAQRSLKAGSRGFTLLEVITVLIIASLLSVVLMQGLALVLNLRTNLGSFLIDLDQKILMRNRITEPLRGVVPDFDDGKDKFIGTIKQVSGLTLSPLFGRAGRPTAFSLAIESNDGDNTVSLIYRENGSAPFLLATLTGEEARFKFLSRSGLWADEWPSENEPIELGVVNTRKSTQIPSLIVLDLNSLSEPDITVALMVKPERTPRDLTF